jgi:hypothetical protein
VGALCGVSFSGEVTIESLLTEMTDYEAVARLPEPAFIVKQASSYDRASKGADDAKGWFANNDWSKFIRSEENQGRVEWVLMDVDGPGAVVRVWFAGTRPKGRVRYYLDGAETPAIDAPACDLIIGTALVGKPLAIENATGGGGNPGGMNLFLPVPYAKHCKMTYGEENAKDPKKPPDQRWYNIEYRTYAPETKVQTFAMKGLESAKAMIENACHTLQFPPPATRKMLREDGMDIQPGIEQKMNLLQTMHTVRQLDLRLKTEKPEDLEQALRSTVLRASFDDEETIWCPVGDFFGCGVGLNSLDSWYRTIDKDGTMTCRWVMPYEKSIQISLLNLGKQKVNAKWKVTMGDSKWDERSMHFHANWRHQYPIPTRPFSDWNYITITGKGVYMGDSLALFNPVTDWWGEGDEKIFRDGEAFPSHFGTGTEDYYCYAWGSTQLFQSPFANQIRCDGPGNKGHTTITRTRMLDRITFTQSLRFDMEIWHWKDCKVGYSVATYWYALPGATSNRGPAPEDAAAPIVQLQNSPKYKIAGAIECEKMDVVAKAEGCKIETQTGDALPNGKWSNEAQLFVRANKIGDFIELRAPVSETAPQKVTLYATKSWDYGVLRFTINGKAAEKECDMFNAQAVASGPIELGVFEPKDGQMTIRVEVAGSNPAAKGTKAFFGLDCIVLSK